MYMSIQSLSGRSEFIKRQSFNRGDEIETWITRGIHRRKHSQHAEAIKEAPL